MTQGSNTAKTGHRNEPQPAPPDGHNPDLLFAYVLAVVQHPGMLSTRVLGNFLTDNAFLGIAAVGMTFVILSGGIDLSVGAVIGFTTVLIAVLIMWLGLHPLAAFAIGHHVATGFGAVMGAAIHYLKVPSFIVTLAGMFLARGGASVLSPDSIGIKHDSLHDHLEKLHPAARRRTADGGGPDHAGGLCRSHSSGAPHAVWVKRLCLGRI